MNRPDADQHVDVIVRPVDDQRGSVHLANNSAEIGEQIIAESGLDQGTSPLGREDEMQQNVS